MKKIQVSIGNDHAGTELKFLIMKTYAEKFEFVNHGTDSHESVDYPDFVHPVANDVERGESLFGIIICGSANGVCMTANKHQGIRAGLAWNREVASLVKQHNNANILGIPARFLSNDEALEVLETYIDQDYEGGRHQRRVDKIPC
jgi:ribose 5-phosphate isomerase B